MDLEDELRQAMAEHVTELSAPRSLASEAKRRHHRTVRRRTVMAVGAAGLVVAAGMIPAYQSFRPETVGSNGHEGREHTPRPSASPARTSLSPGRDGRSGAPVPGSTGSHSPGTPAKGPTGSHGALGAIKVVLGYLPAGVSPTKNCSTTKAGARETTTCHWAGSAGWIDVRLVRDKGLNAPDDLGLTPPMPVHDLVNGHKALRASGLPSQVMWIERQNLGVWVGVSPTLSDRLTRVADGVHIT
jgi:hypothetical protein